MVRLDRDARGAETVKDLAVAVADCLRAVLLRSLT
jgi:hypothetical protein